MLKLLALITLTVICFERVCEVMDSGTLTSDGTGLTERAGDSAMEMEGVSLRQGMGLREVERTLKTEGKERRTVRSISPPTSDPLDWNVGWEIARTYRTDSDGSTQSITAVFEAWTDDDFDGRPPASAFRLVRWE
ncbi:MAG TPA: hypothetical protein DCX60_00285 [Phycisphaerales bacterium]|nr:hypothetical protein [Phycisphaerales bacterium]|tara:strand:- start:884 stop:1288 length:405 start_codon:yes stop_codon:yes gene_type:complete